MIARDVYDALQVEFPGYKHTPLEKKLGLGSGSLSRISNDQGIGMPVAKILYKLNPEKYAGLLAKAEAQKVVSDQLKSTRAAESRMKKKGIKPRKLGLVNPKLIKPKLHAFVGYIG